MRSGDGHKAGSHSAVTPSVCPTQERELSPEELDGEQGGQGGDMGLGEWGGHVLMEGSAVGTRPWRGRPHPRRDLPWGDTVPV